jgi:hypothetical protein
MPLTHFNHREYMRSDWWRARRASYYATHPRRCRACGSARDLNLHHLSYENVYGEPDEDLMPLCETCHAFVHIVQRTTKLPLRKATRLAVAEMRRSPAPVPSKPIGRHEPNAVLFAAVRAEQSKAPQISTRRAKRAGRLAYKLLHGRGR